MQHQQPEPQVTFRLLLPLPDVACPSDWCAACCEREPERERERLLAVNVDDIPVGPDPTTICLPCWSRNAAPSGCHSWQDTHEHEQTRGVDMGAQAGSGGNSLACVASRKASWAVARPGEARWGDKIWVWGEATGQPASQTGNPSISRWQTAIAGC